MSDSNSNEISNVLDISNKNISAKDRQSNPRNWNKTKLNELFINLNNTNLQLNKDIMSDYKNINISTNTININNDISNDIDKYLYDKYKRIFLIVTNIFKQSSEHIFEVEDFGMNKFLDEFIRISKDEEFVKNLHKIIIDNLKEDIDFNMYINEHVKTHINNIIKLNNLR